MSGKGSNPLYGDPYLDGPPVNSVPGQTTTGQLKANHNADPTNHYKDFNHFLAGGRCFGAFMSRNLTPNDYGLPRGLSEEEFIKVMRTGVDISCDFTRPKNKQPIYDGVPDPVCQNPDPNLPPGTVPGVTYNPEVLQTMSWPTYHSMTDRDLKAIYAYLSALPQAYACNTGGLNGDGCAGPLPAPPLSFSYGQAAGKPSGFYAYENSDDCPNPPPPQ
jgi:hypothetical protein